MEGSVTLILNEKRVEVDKRKLASKSCYFASLFSHNFNDSHNKEHVINYNITFSTLQNFVEWIHDDGASTGTECNPVKVSMVKFMKTNYIELLNILKLSVLFAVDELTNNATDIIISHWLLPENLIDIWLLADELSLKVLQDVSLSVCLDRFKELPVSSLTALTKGNITRLLENVNTSDIVEIKDERELKFVHGSIICSNSYIQQSVVKSTFLYTWNGNDLSKCTQLENTRDCESLVIGMQVAGRGFSIYTVGGEKGLGTGKFNNIIWRYCLLSKKWYYQTHLPVPRRHMIAVFLKDKLIVAGGVGRHRLKLNTVDILHIHSGIWTKCATTVPESFTEVPPHCVFDGKLFFLKSSIYIYSIETNYWQIISIENPARQSIAFITHDQTLFSIGDYLGKPVLSRIDVKNLACENGDCLKQCVEHSVTNIMHIIPEYQDDSYRIRYARVAGIDMIILNTDRDEKYQYLHVHTQIREDFENLSIPKLGCINIIDPDTLYDTV